MPASTYLCVKCKIYFYAYQITQTCVIFTECCDDDYTSLFCGQNRIIAFVVILVLCIIIAVLLTFIVTCICARRRYKRAYADHSRSPQEKTSYETVGNTSGTITKDQLELHPNPAYGSGSKMTMNSNPAYKTCN